MEDNISEVKPIENKWRTRTFNHTRFEETILVIGLDNWKKYSIFLVSVLALVKDEDKNKIYDISKGSGELDFTVEHLKYGAGYKTDIHLTYTVDFISRKIHLYYTKTTFTL